MCSLALRRFEYFQDLKNATDDLAFLVVFLKYIHPVRTYVVIYMHCCTQPLLCILPYSATSDGPVLLGGVKREHGGIHGGTGYVTILAVPHLLYLLTPITFISQ